MRKAPARYGQHSNARIRSLCERITAVEEAAKDAGYKDIYKKSLISVTEMEKLMGKKTFSEVLGAFVTKPQGKPTLVPTSDKRRAINVTGAKNDFNEIKE